MVDGASDVVDGAADVVDGDAAGVEPADCRQFGIEERRAGVIKAHDRPAGQCSKSRY